jgi:hypothetical protein
VLHPSAFEYLCIPSSNCSNHKCKIFIALQFGLQQVLFLPNLGNGILEATKKEKKRGSKLPFFRELVMALQKQLKRTKKHGT